MITAKSVQKYKTKSTPHLTKIAQTLVNKYVRLRDSEGGFFTCISCSRTQPIRQMNAGHFFSVGGHSSVRFNLDNIHGQCVQCNLYKHGNLIPYQENLIKKIGEKRYEDLKHLSKLSIKNDRFFLIDLIERFKNSKIAS